MNDIAVMEWIGNRVLDKRGLTWSEKVAYLSWSMRGWEQAECPLEHKFEGEVYTRTIKIPAHVAFIGRPHLTGHLCRLKEGSLIEITESARTVREAPYEVHTTRGTQLVLWTLSDVVADTVHDNPLGCADPSVLEPAIFESKASVWRRGQEVESRLTEAGNSQSSYLAMMSTYGIDPELARRLSEYSEDIIEFPEAADVTVGFSLIEGQGIFAKRRFAPGQIVCVANEGGYRTPAGRYTNHSGMPNVYPRWDDNRLNWVASRHIGEGAEILINYIEAFAVSRMWEPKCLAP